MSTVLVGTASATPATSAPACGTTITQSTTLAGDVGSCAGPGLIIGASNIVLNLNGHSVTGMLNQYGTASSQAPGIEFRNTTGSTVENGSVSGFAVGVLVNRGSSNVVKAINANHNVGPVGTNTYGDGISMEASNSNVIEMNNVADNGPYSGISLLDASNNNRVFDNQVVNNNAETLCGNPTGCGKAAYGSPTTNQDFGISVEGPAATHNLIDNNVVTGSGSDGIDIAASCVPSTEDTFSVSTCTVTTANEYNLVRNNVVNDNGFATPGHGGSGINLFAMGLTPGILMPTHNTIEGNTTNGNNKWGIDIQGGMGMGAGADYNTADHNTADQNLKGGIEVSANKGIGNVVDHNTADNNSGDGFFIGMGSSGNTFAFNAATGNTPFDGADGNGNCSMNTWAHNHFGTSSPACVGS
jgi:hypothetical protein